MLISLSWEIEMSLLIVVGTLAKQVGDCCLRHISLLYLPRNSFIRNIFITCDAGLKED